MHREELMLLSLTGLLHDIGKPILRHHRRSSIGLEKESEEVRKLIEKAKEYTHESLSKEVIRELLNILSFADKDVDIDSIFEFIADADRFSAAERGVRVGEKEVVERFSRCIEKRLENVAGIRYSHEHVPMLIPTFLLHLAEYRSFVGPQAHVSEAPYEDMYSNIVKVLNPIAEALENQKPEEACEKFVDFVSRWKLFEEKLWIPVKPLGTWIQEMLGGATKTSARAESTSLLKTFTDAKNTSFYILVVEPFLEALQRFAKSYKDLYQVLGKRIDAGFVETVLYAMKNSMFFVPAAIYGSLLPDTSLYAHSRLTTALATALGKNLEAALVTIDVRGIQGFISAPVKWGAASRALRGRSLLIQLALEALTRYATELFGVTEANVIADKGGAVDIIFPVSAKFNEMIEKLRSVATELSKEFLGGFAIAISSTKFSRSEIPTLVSVKRKLEKSFRDVIREHSLNLVRDKARVWGSQLGVYKDVEDFDEQTREPVLSSDKLRIVAKPGTPENRYLAEISGGHIVAERGPISISGATHRALVAGSTSRNLFAVVSISAYKMDGSLPEPDRDFVKTLLEVLREVVNKYRGETVKEVYPLFVQVKPEGLGFSLSLGFLPFESTGSIYTLVSLNVAEPLISEEERAQHYEAVMTTLVKTIFKEVLMRTVEKIRTTSTTRLRIDFRAVNIFNPKYFASEKLVDEVFEMLKNLVAQAKGFKLDVDSSFGFVMLNPWYPARKTENGAVELLDLEELTNKGLLGMMKADIDRLGDVVLLYSSWPSRLTTLSEYINLVMKTIAYVELGYRRDLRSYVVSLYAGGDDLVVYGEWSSVLSFAVHTVRRVRELLKPLTLSLGYALTDYKVPILEIYRDAVGLLEGVAKRFRASAAITSPDYVSLIRVATRDGYRYVITNAIPTDPEAWRLRDVVSLGLVDELLKDNFLHIFEEVLRDLYRLSTIGYHVQELVKELHRSKDVSTLGFDALHGSQRLRFVELEIYYKYLWARRESELTKIAEAVMSAFENVKRTWGWTIDVSADIKPLDIREALRILAEIKLPLDLAILKIRESK